MAGPINRYNSQTLKPTADWQQAQIIGLKPRYVKFIFAPGLFFTFNELSSRLIFIQFYAEPQSQRIQHNDNFEMTYFHIRFVSRALTFAPNSLYMGVFERDGKSLQLESVNTNTLFYSNLISIMGQISL
ncbi:unnamed protein product [Protopolystoma xenopodis]|uniref:Uncharacterized protein n=1 Tax=Protopolystoma xenopodis TaxID=117903 RepID=A0A448XL46_9PLAT|nr:unnamed protein product [Protopolystoma xenopodis]